VGSSNPSSRPFSAFSAPLRAKNLRALQSVSVAPIREDFTTDCTDCTDGKEKKRFGKQNLFIREIREIREIRGSFPSAAHLLYRCRNPKMKLNQG
jgi:hypothetical protein